MTLYELIKAISEILPVDTDAFYEYALHTSDDNGGFLRTRYCWWDKAVQDRNIGTDFKKVLIAFKTDITEAEIQPLQQGDFTEFKMQLHYDIKDAVYDDADWDRQFGYCYLYLVDLKNKIYELEYREGLY